MKSGFENIEDLMGKIPRISAGDDFFPGIESRIEARIRERVQRRTRLKNAGNFLLIALAVTINMVTIGYCLDWVNSEQQAASSGCQVYYYEQAQYQVSSLLMSQP